MKVDVVESTKYRQFCAWKPIDAIENPLPTTPLRVAKVELKNAETKLYGFTFEDVDGHKIESYLFPRDFSKCGLEWGADTDAWRNVAFVKNGARYALAPADETINEVNLG